MTWQVQLREALQELKGDRSLQELSDETGLQVGTLWHILEGTRGIGAAVLEQLRRTQPNLVASIFLPADSAIGDSNFAN